MTVPLPALPVIVWAAVTEVLGGGALSFDEALGLADRAPRVTAAARATETKRDFDGRISGSPFNPSVILMPGYRLFQESAREPEFQGEVTQPWSLVGYGGARRRAARAETEVLSVEARSAALAQRLGAARAWVELWAAQRVLEEAKREEQIAADIERLVGKAAALEAETRADLADARAYHAEARLGVIGAEGEVFERGLQLARETATPALAPLVARGELPAINLPPSSEMARYARLAGSLPEVQALGLRARAARLREAEEHAGRGSYGQFGVAVQRDAPGGLVLSAVARFTPSIFDRGERERGPVAAEAVRLDGEQAQAQAMAQAELVIAFHEVDHTREIVEALATDLVPASSEGATLREKIFQAGEATLLEVLHARRVAVSARAREVRARAMHGWARVKLWLLLAALPEADPTASQADGGGRP